MDKPEYTLDFYTALKEVVENKAWVKGDNFIDGIYLKLDSQGQLVTVDVARVSIEEPFNFIKSLSRQKYRIITIATMKELCK